MEIQRRCSLLFKLIYHDTDCSLQNSRAFFSLVSLSTSGGSVHDAKTWEEHGRGMELSVVGFVFMIVLFVGHCSNTSTHQIHLYTAKTSGT
jgi:hypothetical protein